VIVTEDVTDTLPSTSTSTTTVFLTEAAGSTSTPGVADDSFNATVTVVNVVTATLTAVTATTTSLAPLTVADLFPACQNQTSSISVLQNITIPDMLLPSNITLGQVFSVAGEQIDCGTLIKLLGGSPVANLTKRYYHYRRQLKMKRLFRY